MTSSRLFINGAACTADGLMSFDHAAQIIADHAVPLGVEQVSLDQAAGRILAENIVAEFDFPPTGVSAMDGYAVRDADLAQAPASLPVAGVSFAGHPFASALPAGHCVRIFTGAAMPLGTERVIMQEDIHEENGIAHIQRPLGPRRHLRPAGSDFAKGDILVPAGSRLTPQALVGAAAADRPALNVFRKPLISILCCGDELVPPGQEGRPAEKIPESISYGVSALIQQWGGLVIQRRRLVDDLGALQQAAKTAVAMSDIVVVIAGASVGEKDFAKVAFRDKSFELLFSKVAIKPGKPVWFGRKDQSLVIGLPGNPSSAMVTARLFLAPLVAALSGRPVAGAWNWRMMRSALPLDGATDRDIFWRATVNGRIAVPLVSQDSAGQRSMANATHLIRCRPGDLGFPANAIVETLEL